MYASPFLLTTTVLSMVTFTVVVSRLPTKTSWDYRRFLFPHPDFPF